MKLSELKNGIKLQLSNLMIGIICDINYEENMFNMVFGENKIKCQGWDKEDFEIKDLRYTDNLGNDYSVVVIYDENDNILWKSDKYDIEVEYAKLPAWSFIAGGNIVEFRDGKRGIVIQSKGLIEIKEGNRTTGLKEIISMEDKIISDVREVRKDIVKIFKPVDYINLLNGGNNNLELIYERKD
jgi:hypothetical protein